MRALVVVESLFGNTREVAEAIGEAIAPAHPVEVVAVGQAPTAVPADVGLLVVGGPTHAFGLTREGTRADARARGAPTGEGRGLREWLAELPAPPVPTLAAAFDTRIARPRVPGSAAAAAERRLRRLGMRIVVPKTSFWVLDVAGPLEDGELARARRWGAEIAARVSGAAQAG